jgi:hypothetical protein
VADDVDDVDAGSVRGEDAGADVTVTVLVTVTVPALDAEPQPVAVRRVSRARTAPGLRRTPSP